MAATDMSCAQYEPDCLVNVLMAEEVEGSFSDQEAKRLFELASLNPWTMIGLAPDKPLHYIIQSPDGTRREVERYDLLKRDFDEAQDTRHQRFAVLNEVYPSPSDSTTDGIIQRFIGVVKCEDDTFIFCWGDRIDRVMAQMADRVPNGDWPEAVYDLDTGAQTTVHFRARVEPDEEQGAVINPLSPGEMAVFIDFKGSREAALEALRSPTISPRRKVLGEILETENVKEALAMYCDRYGKWRRTERMGDAINRDSASCNLYEAIGRALMRDGKGVNRDPETFRA